MGAGKSTVAICWSRVRISPDPPDIQKPPLGGFFFFSQFFLRQQLLLNYPFEYSGLKVWKKLISKSAINTNDEM